jgi:putative FmdB family regulatory protein
MNSTATRWQDGGETGTISGSLSAEDRMPTYEYRCSQGHDFERVQKMSEAPLDTCPQCGAPAERQLSVGGGLLFKGSGFYITDYRSDSYRKAAEADAGAGKPAKEESAPKPDAAPKPDVASKPDAAPQRDAAKPQSGSGSPPPPKGE